MPDPQTSNLQLYIPLNGADVGSWDVPVNANMQTLDSALGGATGIALTNVPVTLSPAQYASGYIYFTGNLTGDVAITFPPYGRFYFVQSFCTGNVAFNITCKTSAAGGEIVGLPPGQATSLLCDATNMRLGSLPPVGAYMDIAATTVPGWITSCTVPPYLNCDGTAFSSATYPNLRDHLGTNVLPDSKGRLRATLNQGSARLTGASITNGLDGNTFLSGGGNQIFGQTNIPNYAPTDPSHAHITRNAYVVNGGFITVDPGVTTNVAVYGGNDNVVNANFTGITSGGSGNAYAPPSYVGGLTLIRSG